nr:unnamed protein product [Callosobruchus chinensis]
MFRKREKRKNIQALDTIPSSPCKNDRIATRDSNPAGASHRLRDQLNYGEELLNLLYDILHDVCESFRPLIIGFSLPLHSRSLNSTTLTVHESFVDDIRREQLVPLPELLEGDPVGEALSADPDTFQDAVASELVQYQRRVDLSGLLLVVGNDAAHEVRVRVAQSHHQIGQLLFVQVGDRAEHALGPAKALSVLPDVHDERICGTWNAGNGKRYEKKCGEAVETAKHVIFDCPALCRRRSSYLEVVQEEGRQVNEKLITHRLVDQIDGRLQIKPEIDEFPFDPFPLILLLLQNEHGVVEQLLKLLVGIVDAQLFERVQVEYFKTGYVEDTDEASSLSFRPSQKVKNYKRKTWSEESMKNAVNILVKQEIGYTLAAKTYSVTQATLERKVRSSCSPRKSCCSYNFGESSSKPKEKIIF